MTTRESNRDPRVAEAIKRAVDFHSKGQTAMAVEHLSALIPEFPEASALHGYLAVYLSQIGRFDEAIEPARQAVRLSPKSEKASMVLFSVLVEARQHIEALEEAKRFLSIGRSEIYSGMADGLKRIMAEQDSAG